MAAYDLNELRIEGFPAGEIMEMKIVNRPGCHAELHLKAAVLRKEEKWILFEMESYHPITVLGNAKVIFCGLIETVTIENTTESNYVNIIAKSSSVLMDIEKKTRTFQNINETYEGIIKKIMKGYPDAQYVMGFPDSVTGKLIIQYRETDWEFLKRILSEQYRLVAAYSESDKVRLYLGGIDDTVTCDVSLLEVSKDEVSYLRAKELGLNLNESDFTEFKVAIDQCIPLFHSVTYLHTPMMIVSSCYELKKGMLECTYLIKSRPGVLAFPVYPIALVGVALEGKIIEVKESIVRVHLPVDDIYESGDEYWFPFSTMSASPDGSGWYFMPEPGDTVRVHFPTKYASEAIVISAISGYAAPKKKADSMGNPSTKYLSNKSGQNMMLGKNGITIVTKSGKSSVTINNAGTIYIYAQQKIAISATQKLTMKAKQIDTHGIQNISLVSAEGGAVNLAESGNLDLAGAEVFIN